jgi:hypothetical protein
MEVIETAFDINPSWRWFFENRVSSFAQSFPRRGNAPPTAGEHRVSYQPVSAMLLADQTCGRLGWVSQKIFPKKNQPDCALARSSRLLLTTLGVLTLLFLLLTTNFAMSRANNKNKNNNKPQQQRVASKAVAIMRTPNRSRSQFGNDEPNTFRSPGPLMKRNAPKGHNNQDYNVIAATAGRINRSRGNGLSSIARDYAQAIMDPEHGPLVGVPTEWPIAPSFKYRAWATGTMTVGTNGVGFLQCGPGRSQASDYNAIYYSSAAYALLTLPSTYVEGGVSTTSVNSPWAAADFATTSLKLQGRVVGFSMTLTYIGTENNLGGVILSIRHPDNANMITGLTNANLNSFPTAERYAVTTKRDTITLVWVPTASTDVDYVTPSATDPLSMVMYVNSTAGNNFTWAVNGIYETVGVNIPGKSDSHGDPSGFAAVLSTVENSSSSWAGSARSAVSGLVGAAGSELLRMGGRMAAAGGAGAMRLLSQYAQELYDWRSQPRYRIEYASPFHHGPTVEEIHELIKVGTDIITFTIAEFRALVASGAITLLAYEPQLLCIYDDIEYSGVWDMGNIYLTPTPAPPAVASNARQLATITPHAARRV